MIHNGYPRGTLHPFRGSNQSDATVSAPHFGAPAGQSRPLGEMNTLATLSVVFAFVFAPIGVGMGYLALSQIKHLAQRGRDRALVGLTLSWRPANDPEQCAAGHRVGQP